MEVLYHIRAYFVGIFPHIGLKNRPYIWNRYRMTQSEQSEEPRQGRCHPVPKGPGRVSGTGKASFKVASMYLYLVGGAITILKNMKVNGKDYPIYVEWKITNDRQPVYLQ